MTANLVDAQLVELPQNRQIARRIAGQIDVGGSQDKGLVAFVAAILDECRRFGIGPRHNDARNSHNVELQAGSVQSLDLLISCHKNLTSLMAAFFGSRLLVFDVVARHSNLDKASNQIANVRVSAVTGV